VRPFLLGYPVPDLEEVSQTLADNIAALLANESGAPRTGAHTSVFAGWPTSNDLKAALAAGHVCVSVYPMPGATSNVTRNAPDWKLKSPSVVTTTVAVANNVITFGGAITLPLNVGVRIGHIQAVYAAQAGGTLETLAAGVVWALQAMGVSAVAAGATVSITSTDAAEVTLGGRAVYCREAIQIKQVYMISIWAPSQALRMATANAFYGNFFAQTRITLSDGTIGLLLFQREVPSDHSELEGLYRRDTYATVEYAVMEYDYAWDVVTTRSSTEIVDSVAGD
jgi:hypothetical protein